MKPSTAIKTNGYNRQDGTNRTYRASLPSCLLYPFCLSCRTLRYAQPAPLSLHACPTVTPSLPLLLLEPLFTHYPLLSSGKNFGRIFAPASSPFPPQIKNIRRKRLRFRIFVYLYRINAKVRTAATFCASTASLNIHTTRVSVSIDNGSFQHFGRKCCRIFTQKNLLFIPLRQKPTPWAPPHWPSSHSSPSERQ